MTDLKAKEDKKCPILYASGRTPFATCWEAGCAFYDIEKEQCLEKTKVEVLANLVEVFRYLG